MSKRYFVSLTLIVFCALLLIGCGGSGDSNQTASGGGEKIGVPECDDFLAKYEACVTGKVPAEGRAQFNTSLTQLRTQWKQMAGSPQGKESLVQMCKMAADQNKQLLKPYGCEF